MPDAVHGTAWRWSVNERPGLPILERRYLIGVPVSGDPGARKVKEGGRKWAILGRHRAPSAIPGEVLDYALLSVGQIGEQGIG